MIRELRELIEKNGLDAATVQRALDAWALAWDPGAFKAVFGDDEAAADRAWWLCKHIGDVW